MQKNRLFVQEAMKQGAFPSGGYTPPSDASRAYVRGAIDPNATATKARKRFPFVPQPHRKTRDFEAGISKTIKPTPHVQKQDGQHLIDLADSNSRQRQILLNHLWFSVCFERQTAPSRHVLFLHKS